jgi:predicted nucleic acid-binding protein
MHLLDSNILIYALLPEHQKLRDFLKQKELSCSIVSKIEVMGYHKLTRKEKATFQNLFENINILPLTSVSSTTV